CYVRANLKYIAPINPDSLMAYDTQTYCKEQTLYCQPKLLKWLSLGHTPEFPSNTKAQKGVALLSF
ncbi:MAG: hypothetical protein ACK54E_15160, partial [Pseudanabaena sp.]